MRTFIAIEFPALLHTQLATLGRERQAELRARQLGEALRWTPPHQIHLTLRFLGETTAAQTAQLAHGLSAIVAGQAPFALTLAGLGGFPHLRQPRIVWLGVEGAMAPLVALQCQIEALVQACGFVPEARPFAAHLTLARANRSATSTTLRQVGALLQAKPTTTPLPLSVNGIVHMQSLLLPSGAQYTPINHFPFQP